MTKSVFTPRYKAFLDILIKGRRKAKLSQRKLSEILGQSSSFVSKYELGERRLDIVEMLEIASVLKIDPHFIINEVTKIIN